MDFRSWMGKRLLKGGPDDSLLASADAAGQTVDDAADSAQLPDIPVEIQGAVRKPLVVQSARATVSGDDNDERGVLGELSQGLDVNERAALNDPRAAAGQQAMRNNFDDMSNIFLGAARLPQLQQRADPYVSERDKMRDWVMKRGGMARGAETNALNADRTKAYLDATQSQRELALRAQELNAERDGRKADAEKARAEREALEMQRKLDKDKTDAEFKERELRIKEEAEKKKRDQNKPRPGSGGPVMAPKGFPAGWELEGKTQPTPKQGEQFEGLVYAGEKMKGLTGQMRKMLAEAGNGRVLPGPAKPRLSQLAKEIQIEGKNIAELGALSGPDYSLMEAIAADPTKVDSFIKDMPALLDGLDHWGSNSVDAKAKSLGARRTGGSTPQPASAPSAGDTVTVRRKNDGVTKTLPRASAGKFLSDPNFEEVK